MDQLFAQLGALFIGALPSAILLILLVIYLRVVLFSPLEKILAERHSRTGGREQRAAEALRLAEQKLLQYNAALQAAKTEIYAEQDEVRRRLEGERDRAITAATADAKAELGSIRRQLEVDLVAAREVVASEAKLLADAITTKVLAGGGS